MSQSDQTERLYAFDAHIAQERNAVVVGVDEAGRGPLAGPVVAAAVCLDAAKPIAGLNDSKKLSEKRRESLYGEVTSRALAWAAAEVSPDRIDTVNILQATFSAMQQALDRLNLEWTLALVDGNQRIPSLPPANQQCIVDGDALSASIAAASIVAKVTRDRIMREYDTEYPQYGFARHKGYGTVEHRQSIVRHGLCEIHRRSFCGNLVAQTTLALSDGAERSQTT